MTKTMTICNAFSINMLENPDGATVSFKKLTVDEVRGFAPFTSAVGHADTAAVFTNFLGSAVPMNRTTLKLNKGQIIVGQMMGTRLPEGSVTLPEGATIDWFLVTIM